MEFFGVGAPELVLILVIVLVIFGPDQLPEIAKKMGKATRDLRRAMTDINEEVNENLRPFQELKELKDINLLSPAETLPSNLIVAEDAPPQSPAEPPADAAPAPAPGADSASPAASQAAKAQPSNEHPPADDKSGDWSI
ncbi:MAG: twin-arginine translocase TatA/TatE family subunit [Rudaea sp.]